MNAPVRNLIPCLELDALESYLTQTPPVGLEPLFDSLGVPIDATPPRLEIAVAQILLHRSQDQLPQWGCVKGNGEVVLGREGMKRPRGVQALRFDPRLICCINWAGSGPGFSWPEAYHITEIPGFAQYVVTASRDSEDAWGCTDHAIGFCAVDIEIKLAARNIVTAYWTSQLDGWDQGRWAYLFDEGLIGGKEAEAWAAQVWVDDEDSDDDD